MSFQAIGSDPEVIDALPKGIIGPNKVLDLERIEKSVTVPNLGTDDVPAITVDCPSDYLVTGGGYSYSPYKNDINKRWEITHNFANGLSSWFVAFYTPPNSPGTISVFANCISLIPP